MTQSDWLACAGNLHAMLTYLQGKSSMRKWRLSAVACCRRIWAFLPDQESRAAVEATERFADGTIVQRELAVAQSRVPVTAVYRDFRVNLETRREAAARNAAKVTARPTMRPKTIRAEMRQAVDAVWSVEALGKTVQQIGDLQRQFCALLGCIFGQFAFGTLSLDPAWITPTVSSLATAAYEERLLPSGNLDSVRLAILADALEEAGCMVAAILDHLRSTGPHVRGCWAVDLLTGRE